ncbi:monofunctional biosynthetic peptidoglycan transglycosylase [Marinomonas algicola]|uniref:monofunctional biosynthetic peptidoglycan transglycosylase n=1 Tax=Marinomonas algicola TaxID=2773454 RepID=UPI00174D335C|nr:monofunctional biosynthetic peptidoglycan transglycosylase [Marinomonas algicola]
MPKGKRRKLKKAWSLLWRMWLTFALVLLVFRFAPLPTTAFMLQSPYPVKQAWISIDTLPPHIPLAVVASEDQRFPIHFGIDVLEIRNAIIDYGDGEGLRGASTITQQTAKNLFLWPSRSFLRKGLEAGLAVVLEMVWGKKRILEVYLNVAEFGQGMYGVEAASQHYFGRSASTLSATQATRLAIMLPSPRTRTPNRLTPYLRERTEWVEQQMQQLGYDYLKTIID